MQKKLIALAIAGIAAAPAFAQSNVTVYGRVDYGYESRGGDSGLVNTAGTKSEMASGIQAGSRIGFKGSEDLGGGLKAIFEVESGLQNDANNGGSSAGIWSSANRHAYVGLSSDKWGTLVGGRLDGVRYGVYNKYDAFAGGGMGNFTQMTLQVDRADNAIAWISPNWKGFNLVLAHSRQVAGQEYGTSQTTNGTSTAALANANTADGRLYTIKGAYENGPISIDLDYETVKVKNSNAFFPAAATGTTCVPAAPGAACLIAATTATAIGGMVDDVVVWTVAGSYDFGMIKVRALYDHHEADGSRNFRTVATKSQAVDYDAWFLSATVPYGNFLFKGTYGQINENRNHLERGNTVVGGVVTAYSSAVQGDATKWGLGMNYNLSKRTNVYLDYAQINNDRSANYQLNPAANGQGTGYGTSGWNLGLAHNF